MDRVHRLSFKEKIESVSKRNNSRIVLALDIPIDESEALLKRALKIIDVTNDQICAVKFNRHLILPLGLFSGVQKLLTKVSEYGLPTIMDCKINDIGNTNKIIAKYYFSAGFNALTANPFVGWKEGLEPVFDVARKYNSGVILLVFMSHKGSTEGYGQNIIVNEMGSASPQYKVFTQKALTWGADGVVVGATFPNKIREIYSTLGKTIPIYSPGVGAQGGKIEDVIKHGGRYIIVGRTITMSKDPQKIAKSLRIVAQKALLKE